MKIARTLGVVIVFALGAGACSSGVTQARTVPPGPVSPAAAGVAAKSQPTDTTAGATTQFAAPATAAPHTAVPGGGQSAPKSVTAPPAVSSPATSAPSVTTKASVPPVTVPSLAARRQPTTAEIAQVIANVKTALPFVTLTAAQIAQAGNQVCSAFDQGKTFPQVTTQVLTTLGGAALGGLIPASVPAGAVRTLVTLFCPGYASKLV